MNLSFTLEPPPTRSTDPKHTSRDIWAAVGGILLSNALAAGAYGFGWIGRGELLWTYWIQSVLIGVFNFARMMSLKQFSTKGLKSNGRAVPETPAGKRSAATFFLFHYGFFHVVYAVFLSQVWEGGLGWVLWLGAGTLAFGIGEAMAFAQRRAVDATWKPNLGGIMFQPYLRIIPMHLTIIASGAGVGAMWIFIPLKIVADAGMYLVEAARDARRATAAAAAAAAATGDLSPRNESGEG